MKSWKDVIEDVQEIVETFIDDIKTEVSSIDVDEILTSENFKTAVTTLLNGKYILGYSLISYIVKQMENNSSSSSGWSVIGNTLTALENATENLLLLTNSNYSTVEKIDASSSVNPLVLVGNALSNAIIAGSGGSTLWGGGEGNNTLTGGAARDNFWYFGGGNDFVTNFVAGLAGNSDVAVLAGELANVLRDGENVTINLSDGNFINLQTSSDSSDDVIQYSLDGDNIFGAVIADNSARRLLYNAAANYFQLSQSGALDIFGSERNEIWLDGSSGKSFVNISEIDASAATGENILAGNGAENSIIGGAGISSLWGGAGNVSDTLIGGDGQDMFWYGKNDGADVIENSASTDIVNLYDITLENVSSALSDGDIISVVFDTGASLNVEYNENKSPTFQLANGDKWQFNNTVSDWQAVS